MSPNTARSIPFSRVVDPEELEVALAQTRAWIRADVIESGLDADPEIDLRVTHKGQLALERRGWIGFAVDADNEFAPAPEQFVNAHVLDVTAVGQVQPRLVLRHMSPRLPPSSGSRSRDALRCNDPAS